MKPYGSTWRHGRARLDLSAEDAADRLRVSAQYLRNIESNQPRATPSERLVYRAAALYGVGFWDLVSDESDDDEPDDEPAKKPAKRPRPRDPAAPPPRRNGKDDKRRPGNEMRVEARAAS